MKNEILEILLYSLHRNHSINLEMLVFLQLFHLMMFIILKKKIHHYIVYVEINK